MDVTHSQVLELRIPADTRYVALVRRGIRSLAESMGFASGDIADVEVAVSEAVTNSVVHGSCGVDHAAVVVRCCAGDDCLVVEIEDLSKVDGLPPSPPECDHLCEGGRGVAIMRALVDELEDSRTDVGLKVRLAKQMARV